MRVVPPYRGLYSALPRRLRWTRARLPTRRRLPRLYRPEGRTLERPSARSSLWHLLTTLGVVAGIWLLGAAFQTAFAGRIFPHITIDHVPVGGMTRAEALAALRDSEAVRVSTPIYAQVGDQILRVTPAQFGARYDIAAAVDRALALARNGPLVVGGWNEASTIINGANVPLSGSHDTAAVARFLAGLARRVYLSPRGALVGVSGGDVAILREAALGHRLDLPGAATALGAVINTHDATAVTLPLQPIASALGHAQAQAAVSHARALLAAPITFVWTANAANYNRSWRLDREGLLRLMTFTPRCAVRTCRFDLGVNTRTLAEAFNRGGVYAKVYRRPANASFTLYAANDPASTSVHILPATSGLTINVEQAAALILDQGAMPGPGARTVLLPTLPIAPSFDANDAAALNFTVNVGRGVLHFHGLDWARRDNINVATNVISDTIVPSGRTFDLAALAGPLTAAGGYIKGQNALGPGDITGVNGGVDQVASAVLGAAYDAGLPVVRRDHYPYLSAFAPPGLDAMVTYSAGKGQRNNPDLIFRNTTSHPILVMTSDDGVGGVGVYIFNSTGYAPGRQSGAYTSTVGPPQITLNPDGSVDTVIARTITTNGHTTNDSISSHAVPIDP